MDRRTFIKTAGSSALAASLVSRPQESQAQETNACVYGENMYGNDVYNGSSTCAVPTQVTLKESDAFAQTNWFAGVSALILGAFSWIVWRRDTQARELD